MAKNKLNKNQGHASGHTSHKQEKKEQHRKQVEKEIRQKEKAEKKKARLEKKKKRDEHRGPNREKGFVDVLIWFGASVIYALDEILDEAGEIGKAGAEDIINVCAGLVVVLDVILDIIFWIITKTFILVARKLHETRMAVHQHRRAITQVFMLGLIAATATIALISSMTDFEYSYNGKKLGIVRDQQDVLEILDLVSEELTQEYGSSISINPETDIRFERVFSYGKNVDDADTVLRRLTYMGDVQAQASAIYADGEICNCVL